MYAFNRKTGSRIVGTLEKLEGTAEILIDSYERNADGTVAFEHGGYTRIDWDAQLTVERDGRPVFVDEDGSECGEADLALSAHATAYSEDGDLGARPRTGRALDGDEDDAAEHARVEATVENFRENFHAPEPLPPVMRRDDEDKR
jgi:hypothetical protein